MLVRAYIDTNLLLQFKPVTQLDWKALLGASRVELVVIPAVLRELEDKTGASSRAAPLGSSCASWQVSA